MSRFNISHTTDIEAPIEQVWAALIQIDDWEWNKWTKLETGDQQASTGTKGKLKASYEGNDQWETFDFEFGDVREDQHLVAWKGSVGPKGCLFCGLHSMQLEAVQQGKTRTTRLVHTEQFSGLLPMLGMGLPYKTLKRNYLLMNEALKKHVEAKQ